jgi:hypothetical protein
MAKLEAQLEVRLASTDGFLLNRHTGLLVPLPENQ